MVFEIEKKTVRWLLSLKIIKQHEVKPASQGKFEFDQQVIPLFQNGLKVSSIVSEIYKKRGIPVPSSLSHLKQSNQTAAQLFNWNTINEAIKKIGLEIDSQTKNLIINGDHAHLEMVLRQLHKLYEQSEDFEDSLQTNEMRGKQKQQQEQTVPHNNIRESLTLSRSQQPNNKNRALQNMVKEERSSTGLASGDLLQFIIKQLMQYLKLTRKQALALLSENNKYLAHVLVKGVKGQFNDIEQLMQKLYESLDYVVQQMMQQNDMCFFFLQIIKPALLSKSEEIAQWGCRILSKIGYQLADKQMLPLAYDWFVRDAGGLSTTILALQRHPKLNQHVVGYIIQFARYNVAELFTIQLKKITNNDNMAYLRFLLLILEPLVESKTSAQQLLASGAIDYWVQMCVKNAEVDQKISNLQQRMICIQILIKIWRAFPIHIEETLDQVNPIMNLIKKGIRDGSQIMRFSLCELLFNLLDQFASRKNPYASIVYKKLTFLFIENHEELTMREFMLRNFGIVFQKYTTIPVDIFLEPFVKQVKISESKSYLVNIFDFEFIEVAVRHKKLKVSIALQLYDLLAKTKLNSHVFARFAQDAMDILLDRFLEEQIFLQYTVKLVKISLAMLYSTLKTKKQLNDPQRLQAQKRAQIINFVISLIERGSTTLNDEIKDLVVHVKVQIYNKLGIEHKGVERILGLFSNVEEAVAEAMQNMKDQSESNATSTKSRNDFHLPKITGSRHLYRDDNTSQQSFKTSSSKLSRQQFPIKDYTEYATQDQKKFIKQNGMGLKKKAMSKSRRAPSYEKEIDPKLHQHLVKIKQRKQEQVRKKEKEQQQIRRRKELLQIKIQKELQQRNLKQGMRGIEKDQEVKVLFEENQINEKILGEDETLRIISLEDQETRNSESIRLVLRKHVNFIKKVFSRYCNAKNVRKEFFNEQGEFMNQVDLLKFCKQKNLEKNKQTITELLKMANDRNVNTIELDAFTRFLQVLCLATAQKDKFDIKVPIGELMKIMLKKMAVGEKVKLEEEEDQTARALTQKIQYNAHIDLPENYRKITEKTYVWKHQITYPVAKAIKNESFLVSYATVSGILHDLFDFDCVEQEVRFIQQMRVVSKKQAFLPPKPLKKEKQEGSTINFRLQQKESAPNRTKPSTSIRKTSNRRVESVEKENHSSSKQKPKIVNAAEKKKLQQQEEKQKKKEKEEQLRKVRQAEVRRKLELQQQEREKEKSVKKEEQRQQNRKDQEKTKREKQEKQRYRKQQKEKVQKHKKQQEEKDKDEKKKQEETKRREDQQKKQKFKHQMKKQEQKRKEQYERMKKEKQLEQEKEKRKKEEQEKMKQQVRKQVMKKLQNEKEKTETNKLVKEVIKKIYNQPDIINVFSRHKQELKGLFSYGTEYNDFKLDKPNQNQLGQKGWITICHQLNICDSNTASKSLKQQMREKGRGFNQDEFQETLLGIATKKQMEQDMEDYDKMKKTCTSRLTKYLQSLKIPKDKQRMKEHFMSLKNKEQINVTGPNGQRQTWEVQE